MLLDYGDENMKQTLKIVVTVLFTVGLVVIMLMSCSNVKVARLKKLNSAAAAKPANNGEFRCSRVCVLSMCVRVCSVCVWCVYQYTHSMCHVDSTIIIIINIVIFLMSMYQHYIIIQIRYNHNLVTFNPCNTDSRYLQVLRTSASSE